MHSKGLILICLCALIKCKGWRRIGTGPFETPASGCSAREHSVICKDCGGGEYANCGWTLIPGRGGRHGKSCILLEQCNEAVHVRAFPCLHKMIQKPLGSFIIQRVGRHFRFLSLITFG